MYDSEGQIVVVFNGEIYNSEELKRQLEPSHRFRSHADTEVLLYAYKEWGIDCLQKLNGMFAFLIYDQRKDLLYAVRDRLGIKPLYYLKQADKILLASEIKSLLACKSYIRKLDYQAVSSYLSYRYPLGNRTFFEGISALDPGCFLKVTRKSIEKFRYWSLTPRQRLHDKGEGFYLTRITSLLEAAVKRRMRSDVPLGSCLSGGLDSSAVVAIMAKNASLPVKTFTIGFTEDGYNEFRYAHAVARKCRTDHTEITLSASQYLETLKELIRFNDAPLGVPSAVPLYLLSRALKKYITVVLLGEGSDEIFSGYGRLFRSPFDYYRMRILRSIPLAASLPLIGKARQNLKQKYHTLEFENQLDHFLHQYTYFPGHEKWSLFSEEMLRKIALDSWIHELFRSYFYRFNMSYYRRINYVFTELHLPELLQKVDSCTMAASVEARVPFVDHELVEFVMDVPVKYKLKWKSMKDFCRSLILNSSQISESRDITKYILRQVMNDQLPAEVLTREKKGFPVPLDIWFKGGFIDLARRELLSKSSKVMDIFDRDRLKMWIEGHSAHNFGQKLWMILNLEYFLRESFEWTQPTFHTQDRYEAAGILTQQGVPLGLENQGSAVIAGESRLNPARVDDRTQESLGLGGINQ